MTADRRRATILEGPIPEGVFRIALPSVATMLLLTANSFLDRWFIGHLGTEAQAAVTNAMQLMFTLSAGALAIMIGAAALIGRAIGAGEEEKAVHTLRYALICALVLGVAFAVPVLLLREPILGLMNVQPETLPVAREYLFYTMLAIPSLFVMQSFNGAFRGLGDTVRPLRVMIGSVLVHALCNAALIFGVEPLGIPSYGAPGGAMALNISQWVAVGLYLLLLKGTPLAPALQHRMMPDRSEARVEIRRLLTIGLPAGGQQLLRTGSLLLFTWIVGQAVGDSHATAAAAALGVGLVAEAISFMPGLGYQSAASSFVAQNLGAVQLERARRAGWAAAWQAVGVMSVMGLLFVLAARPFAHLFLAPPAGSDPEQQARAADAVAFTVAYLQAAFLAQPFLGLSMVFSGALQGAGETKSPTLVTAVTMIAIRLPLAWAMTRLFGVTGAWWSMTVTTVLQGLGMALVFRQGRWLKTKV